MANKNLFNSIKLNKPRRNTFDLSFDHKLSFKMGELVPIMCMEAVPGDKFNIGNDSLLRFQPLVAPVMHRFNVTCHYFFVPNRIAWPDWEKWIVNDPTAGAFPFVNVSTAAGNWGSLMDHLGIPQPIGANVEKINAFPLAAYQRVWNEYYRDQNLQTAYNADLINGDNTANTDLFDLQTRCWEHDYFTSALPFAQKGDAVDIPLGTGIVEYNNTGNDPGIMRSAATGNPVDGDVVAEAVTGEVEVGITPAAYDPNGTLSTNLDPTTINDLRRAFKLQEWLERNARAGTRYIENILGHFGIRGDDARMQRPEYITGVKSPVIVSEVLNTTGTDDAPQGAMAGHGVSVNQGQYGSYFCKEHGYIIGVMSVLPKTAYQQGIPKHFLKTEDPFQYFWPAFANIGEQEILNKELYAFQGAAGSETFGYTPRYAEYKYQPSMVSGEFKTSLNFWHAGRIFASPPALNETFVQSNPTDRIFAVTDPSVDTMLAHVLNKVYVSRLMPKFGTPTF